MGEYSNFDFYAGAKIRAKCADKALSFRPLRLGETARKCEKCSAEYQPTSRTQKYCQECRGKK